MLFNFNYAVFADDFPKDIVFEDKEPNQRGVLGPNSELQTREHCFEAEIIEAIVMKSTKVLVWGWVDYDDIFNNTKRHRTEFCFNVCGNRTADGEIFIGFTPHGPFNGSDDECSRSPAPYTP